ncbi:cytochrome b-245 chaperone 1-like [Littorina saxatilis]|uniref:Essential for reactive oxygen species protein n=1 Tax=Littorina saxatilis TaxID=31220 RepID=A0AAN9GN73_9CAEN
MGYVTIKVNTKDQLCLCREPNHWSWGVLFGALGIGCGAAFYGTDYFLWKVAYVVGALYAGLLWMEGWEECELDKKTGEMKITRKTVFQKLLPQYADQKIVVVQLDDIVGVRVDEEDVRYFGKSHIVVFLLSTGAIIGVTESHTFGSSKEHYEVADTLRTFLELDQPTQQVQDTDDYLGDGSSSDDSFEQVDRMDLEADLDLDPPTAPSPQ